MPFAGMFAGIGVKLAILAALAAAAGVFYWHYTGIIKERNAAIAQAGALQLANEVQQGTIQDQGKAITNWAESQAQMQATLDALATAQVEANSTARKLNDVLGRHDLTALSLAKPGLIERRINSGTADILRMFRVATGGSDK